MIIYIIIYISEDNFYHLLEAPENVCPLHKLRLSGRSARLCASLPTDNSSLYSEVHSTRGSCHAVNEGADYSNNNKGLYTKHAAVANSTPRGSRLYTYVNIYSCSLLIELYINLSYC